MNLKQAMLTIWLIMTIGTGLFLLIGTIGIIDALWFNDPDEWISIGQYANGWIFMIICLLTFKALRK